MSRLRPRTITIESTVKFFELDRGMSSGSTVQMQFDIPDDMEDAELKIVRMEEKERLDLVLLSMEVARGGMSVENYSKRKNAIKANYDKLLKRNQE